MEERIVMPYAPILVESTRSIGYSFEAAVADIIDNSISAAATEVRVCFSSKDPQWLCIEDDGWGMTPEELENAIQTYFGGDADGVAECYFRELMKVAEEPKVRICGHFDLLLKFQERQPLFDPQSSRYLTAASRALNALLDAGKVIEINTGAVSQGWRSEPYPQRKWLKQMALRGAQVMLSSDAHATAHVISFFEEAEALLRDCGFDHVVELGPDGTFLPVSLVDRLN